MKALKNDLIGSILQIGNPSVTNGPVTLAKQSLSAFLIRSLQLPGDLSEIHHWVNQAYAIPFWQLNGSFDQLATIYRELQACPYAHSLVGCMDDGIVCQLDIYDPFFDTLLHFYAPLPGDLGMHLLMAPVQHRIEGFTAAILSHLLDYLFQSPLVMRLLAEPDEGNIPANQLLQKLRFDHLGRLQMMHKTANLYAITRQQFSERAAVTR